MRVPFSAFRSALGVLLMSFAANATAPAGSPPGQLDAQVAKLAERRIFFGHQSVGRNLLEGLHRVASQVKVVEGKDPQALPAGGFLHVNIGENEKPLGKIRAFHDLMTGGLGDQVDVAFLKLCYIDFNAQTNAATLFDEYKGALADLKARFPKTTFVHVTTPLTTVNDSWKAKLKKLFGRAPWGAEENAVREQYNALMRAEYGGKEPLFDLAKLESTRDDGSQVSYEWARRRSPMLVPEYTDDGGHLVPAAQDRIARQLVVFLAQLERPAERAQGP
jgi:hypothetical protein